MKPQYLKAENEAMEACIHYYETVMPYSPVSAHLKDRIRRNEETIRTMEEWLETVPDAFLRDAIKAYQRCGSWSSACMKMYGYGNNQTLRKSVERFLERFG